MPRIRNWEEDIDDLETHDLQEKIEKRNKSNFRKGLSTDDRKVGKVKRGKVLIFDEEDVR